MPYLKMFVSKSSTIYHKMGSLGHFLSELQAWEGLTLGLNGLGLSRPRKVVQRGDTYGHVHLDKLNTPMGVSPLYDSGGRS